ncbi:hypothetical protein CVH13_00904 [Dehalococcoides mccartyi]|uniref:SCP domain-containing protein n=1 Tax=Dehalococcoides mccartyi TaxID=61435 RepID=A0A2J1DXD8_9CHLR|nr:hypothetical protein CVH13_00904 [Dehalococcoides mccartyi]
MLNSYAIHRLINKRRKQIYAPKLRWSFKLYRLAKENSRIMAKTGGMRHLTDTQYSECLCTGPLNMSSRDAFYLWVHNPENWEIMRNPYLVNAAVSIYRNKKGVYITWICRAKTRSRLFL